MLRSLFAFVVLALALPAQWLGPTNISIRVGRADVFVSGGKTYMLVSHVGGSPWIDVWKAPSRMQVEIRLAGLLAHDPRPCAQPIYSDPYGHVSRLQWGDPICVAGGDWTIPDGGWLWWTDPLTRNRFRSIDVDVLPLNVTYWTCMAPNTICRPVGDPALVAMLFEIVPL